MPSGGFDLDNWRVRGHLTSEQLTPKRFKFGQRKVGCRIDTHQVSVLVSLSADGLLHVQLSRPGSLQHTTLVRGQLEVGGAGLPELRGQDGTGC